MNPLDPNVQQLQIVAGALENFRETFIFVGGCVVGILITEAARAPVRATQDVDFIAEITSKVEYFATASELRRLGFPQTPEDEVICRWRYGNLKIGVMASQEGVFGFTNRWYADAVDNSVHRSIAGRNRHSPDHDALLPSNQ